MIRTALALAHKGMKVFPCLPRQKEPATQHGCKDATADPEIIQAWWRERPDCNVAIATGAASNVFVVDVDGLGAERELRKLEVEHGELPATVESITARGRHLFFKMPATPVKNTAGKIAANVDTRGDGGYVLCPPSIHPSGRVYAWSVDSANAIAEAPDWLLARITDRTHGNGVPATPPSEWRALMTAGADEGQRDNAATRLCGYFLRHHVDALLVLETLQLWNAARCRPPLPMEDIERIVNSISNKELRRRHGHDGDR